MTQMQQAVAREPPSKVCDESVHRGHPVQQESSHRVALLPTHWCDGYLPNPACLLQKVFQKPHGGPESALVAERHPVISVWLPIGPQDDSETPHANHFQWLSDVSQASEDRPKATEAWHR
jgi:hypothetical protein